MKDISDVCTDERMYVSKRTVQMRTVRGGTSEPHKTALSDCKNTLPGVPHGLQIVTMSHIRTRESMGSKPTITPLSGGRQASRHRTSGIQDGI
jgi:hypothetical protein